MFHVEHLEGLTRLSSHMPMLIAGSCKNDFGTSQRRPVVMIGEPRPLVLNLGSHGLD
jgi:hypothetical protein